MEYIGTPIKGQKDQNVQSLSCISSSPTATTSGTLGLSVPQQPPSSTNLQESTPSAKPVPPAPILVEQQTPATSTKSDALSEPVPGDVMEKKLQSAKGTGATRVHPKATVTFEDNEEDEVDDEEEDEEEEEEDQEEEEEDDSGEEAEEVEEVEEGGRGKKSSHKKAAAKRKSTATHRAGKRSRVKSKADGAPKHANGVHSGKRKKTPVVDRISKASNTRAGKAHGSK